MSPTCEKFATQVNSKILRDVWALVGDALCSRVGAAFYGGTAECPQCSSTTGAGTAPGRNLECTRGPQGGSGPHRKLGRESLGSTAGRSMCGASWSYGRHRTALGRKLLVALPRAISAPARLPEPARRSTSPSGLRPPGLTERTPKPKTKANPNTMYLQSTLGGDLGSGHFYLAENRTLLLCVDTKDRTQRTGTPRSLRKRRFCGTS
jgi:hypothetical protein